MSAFWTKTRLRRMRQSLRRRLYGVGPEKVFCIGLHKTGTSSIGRALHILGYNVTGNIKYKKNAYEPQILGDLIARLGRFDAFQDTPWCLYYQTFFFAFPEAKFILTMRDEDAWFDSMVLFFGDAPNAMHDLIYDAPYPAGNRDKYIQRYRSHNEAVKAFFSARTDRFLKMDFARGDGWSKLGEFLNCRTPNVPFPHENRRVSVSI